MFRNYPELYGTEINIHDLQNRKSAEIISGITNFQNLIEIISVRRNSDSSEIIIIKFLLDIPNAPIIDIIKDEIVALVISTNDNNIPLVYALREDFPLGLPHTNSRKNSYPVNLCIFEETHQELKHKWSGVFFLKNIKSWFELTARNELHSDDQPLESFIIGNGGLVYREGSLYLEKLENNYYRTTDNNSKLDCLKISIISDPIPNGIINLGIDNLYDLLKLFSDNGISIEELFESQVLKWFEFGIENRLSKSFWNAIIILYIKIPILRNDGSIENSLITFKINTSIGYIINLMGYSIISYDNIHKSDKDFSKDKISNIEIETLNLMFDLDTDYAKVLSNIENNDGNNKISLVGCGALGSQLFMNLARSGWGKWNLIDKDYLLPHNFIRHASYNIVEHTAKNKAVSLSNAANLLLTDNGFSTPFAKNVFDVDPDVINASDIIIDVSTSISVERYLANKFTEKRKYSSFLNPEGSDLVLLAEDSQMEKTLDLVEFQYYKELLNEPLLSKHLEYKITGKIRYARGCRDITSKIPQDNLAIYSGILSKSIKKEIKNGNGRINIWSISENNAVNNFNFGLDDWHEIIVNDWTIYVNQTSLLKSLSEFRQSKLPNETGGILIGGVDKFYKKIYVVDTIFAPADSIEKPTLFIRGIKGVKTRLLEIESITNNNLYYLGEWHSHPDGCSLNMSTDDKIQFIELLEEGLHRGEPSLMLILGANNNFSLYLGNNEI